MTDISFLRVCVNGEKLEGAERLLFSSISDLILLIFILYDFMMSPEVVFFIFAMLFSFKISAILYIFPRINNKKEASANLYLSVYYFLIGYVILCGILTVTGLIKSFPNIYGTAHIGVYLIMPLPYLYMRRVLMQTKLSCKDAIHFLPAILYIIDLANLLFLSYDSKLNIVLQRISNGNLPADFVNGWLLPIGTHVYLSCGMFILYVMLQMRLLWKMYREFGPAIVKDNRAWFSWLSFFTLLEMIFLLPIVYLIVFNSDEIPIHLWMQGSILFIAMVIITSVYLIVKPEILSGISGIVIHPNKELEEDYSLLEENGSKELQDQEMSVPVSQYISQEQVEVLNETLNEFLLVEKPYLEPNCTIYDIAQKTEYSVKVISAYVNHYLDMNFVDFLNKHRVDFCIKMMLKKENANLTLQALAEMSGFGNRTSFVNAFKRHKGETPSQFYKKLKLVSSN